MIFPVPIPMYMPSSSYQIYQPRVDTHRIESGLDDISGAIKEMSAKLDEKDICITTDTDSIRQVMAFVGPYVQRESDAYHARARLVGERINKIDKWKRKRKKKKDEWLKEEAALWNEAKRQDAEFNYRNQPKGKWWKGWVEKSYSEFLCESGYEAPEEKWELKSEFDWYKSHLSSMVELEMISARSNYRSFDVDRIAKKPFWIDQSSQITKLWDICEQIRGATLQVPSDLMQMVAQIVKESGISIEQGHKCGGCGSSNYIIEQGRKVCSYCRSPKGG